MTGRFNKSTGITKFLIILFWLGIWQIISMITGLEMIFPGPVNVFLSLFSMIRTKIYYVVIGTSLLKIGTGFVLGFVTGNILGVLSKLSTVFKAFTEPVVMLMKSLPVAAFIVLLLVWFGSSKVSVIISFMVVVPGCVMAVYEGLEAVDPQIDEMARVYRIGILKKIRYIYIPAVYPYMEAGLKVGIGMCFKAGVSAEVIGLIKNSIGEQIYYTKLYIMTSELFAWSITIMAVSFIFEKIVLRLLSFVVKICKHGYLI